MNSQVLEIWSVRRLVTCNKGSRESTANGVKMEQRQLEYRYLLVWGAAYLKWRRNIGEGCGSLVTPGGDSGCSPHLKHTETHTTRTNDGKHETPRCHRDYKTPSFIIKSWESKDDYKCEVAGSLMKWWHITATTFTVWLTGALLSYNVKQKVCETYWLVILWLWWGRNRRRRGHWSCSSGWRHHCRLHRGEGMLARGWGVLGLRGWLRLSSPGLHQSCRLLSQSSAEANTKLLNGHLNGGDTSKADVMSCNGLMLWFLFALPICFWNIPG